MKNKDAFIKSAYFDGGKPAIDAFIQKHLKYPAAAIAKKVEGKVNLFLDIDHTGKVINVKIVSGIGHGCDQEAVRVVKMMQFEVDKVRKMHVVFHQKLTISFKIPVEPIVEPNLEVPQEQQQPFFYQYSIVTTPTPATTKATSEKKPSETYTYTL